MKKFIFTLICILFTTPAFAQPVNEWTIQRPNWVEKGAGIAYESAPGVYSETDPTIGSRVGEWFMETGPLTWTLDKGDKMLYLHRGGKTLGLRPKALYYVDKPTWDFTKIADVQSPSNVTVGTDTILFEDIFLNVDAELISKKSGVTMKYTFKSKAGYSPTPYDPATTWVVVGHDLDVTNAPDLFQDDLSTPVNWAGTDTHGFVAVALKNYGFFPTEAVDANEDRTPVRNFLVEKAGVKYMTEAVKYNWFLSAALPVTFEGYDTEGGNLSADDTWVSGTTYLVTNNVGVSTYELTIEGGAFVKLYPQSAATSVTISNNGGAGILTIGGGADNHAYFTVCADDPADGFGIENASMEVTDSTVGGPAACDGDPTTAPGGQANGIHVGTTDDVIDGAEIHYFGLDGSGDLFGAIGTPSGGSIVKGTADLLTVKNTFIHAADWTVTNAAGCVSINHGAANVAGVNIENNVCLFDGTRSGRCFYWSPGSGAVNRNNSYIKNNLCITEGAGTEAVYHSGAGSVASGNDFLTNNTIIGIGSPNPQEGFRIGGSSENITARNNIIGNFNRCYDGAGLTEDSDYNIALDTCTNGFNFDWTSGANDQSGVSLTFGTHADDDYLPAAMRAYHLPVGSALIDAGHDTAANLSLDTRHAIVDGTDDTGTVDMGFHYFSGAAGGGGPDGTCDNNGWWGGSEYQSILFICDRLGIESTSCFSETIGLESIVNNRFETDYSGLTLAPMLRVWDSLATEEAIDASDTEIDSLKSICFAYDNTCPQDRTEAFYWSRLAECINLD